MFRELQEYQKHEAPTHPTSVIHTTFEPVSEKNDYVEFDIKSAGLTSHMSSVMYLEREFTYVIKNVSTADEQFVLSSIYEHERLYRPLDDSRITKDLAFVVKPGFRIQENVKKMHFTFNGGGASFDTEWLTPYCKLYAEKLKQFVRGSGRTFSNHKDHVIRQNLLNFDGDGRLMYCNPERNDRRLRENIDDTMFTDDHYYYNNFLLEDGNQFNPVTVPIGSLLGWNQNLQVPSNDPNAPLDLYHDTPLNTIVPHANPNTLFAYYQFHFAAGDIAQYEIVKNLIDKIYTPGPAPILKHETNNGVDAEWAQLKTIYQQYFGAGNHFNWGVDLEAPLPMHKRILHFRTIALLYQFAYRVLRHFLDFKQFPALADIEYQRETVEFIATEINLYPQNGGFLYHYNESLATIANLNLQLTNIQDNDAQQAKQAEIDAETDRANTLLEGLMEHDIDPSTQGVGESEIQFLNRMHNAATQTLGDLQLAWEQQSHVHDPHPFVTQANTFLRYVQIFSRLDHLRSAPRPEGVVIYSVTLFEPIMVGPCMPSEHTSVGCYSKNSPIIPYIERFNLKMDFDNTDMFELDQYDTTDMITNIFDYQRYLPITSIVSTSSKLHCTFVEQPVQLPVQIPCVDTETFKIDSLVLTLQPTVVSFKDLSLRRKPSLIMFYCKSSINKRHTAFILSDKSASIVKCSLSLDNYNRSFQCDTKSAIDIVSMRNYPCYIPPIHSTGNVFALPFSELPVRKSVQSGYNHLHGQLTIEQSFIDELPTDVFVTFMYHDKFFDVSNNYQTVRLDLDI